MWLEDQVKQLGFHFHLTFHEAREVPHGGRLASRSGWAAVQTISFQFTEAVECLMQTHLDWNPVWSRGGQKGWHRLFFTALVWLTASKGPRFVISSKFQSRFFKPPPPETPRAIHRTCLPFEILRHFTHQFLAFVSSWMLRMMFCTTSMLVAWPRKSINNAMYNSPGPYDLLLSCITRGVNKIDVDRLVNGVIDQLSMMVQFQIL